MPDMTSLSHHKVLLSTNLKEKCGNSNNGVLPHLACAFVTRLTANANLMSRYCSQSSYVMPC